MIIEKWREEREFGEVAAIIFPLRGEKKPRQASTVAAAKEEQICTAALLPHPLATLTAGGGLASTVAGTSIPVEDGQRPTWQEYCNVVH
uniref:Uncharacterized protein n=1 Tax=Leersia perrieri TaxID=77586 RepID=A0A0D9W313_9ORYZ